MPLIILGAGLYLPPAHDVRELVTAHGGDIGKYASWTKVCVAREDDHPGNMAARALQDALDRAGIPAAKLDIVVFAGASRDYPPSWSVATEAMRLCGASDRCLGLDVTAGCAATLAGLELVNGWLALRGGGYGAVVVAERWNFTIDYANEATRGIWTHGDSGAALVVGQGGDEPGIATFQGAEFASLADNNGHVLIPYGGTREPVAPSGIDPFVRVVSGRTPQDLIDSYSLSFARAYAALRRRFDTRPARLLCNQMSPKLVGVVSEALGMTAGQTVSTGDETGHLGGADIVVGLRRITGDGPLRESVLVASSTAYAFGTGFLLPPIAPAEIADFPLPQEQFGEDDNEEHCKEPAYPWRELPGLCRRVGARRRRGTGPAG